MHHNSWSSNWGGWSLGLEGVWNLHAPSYSTAIDPVVIGIMTLYLKAKKSTCFALWWILGGFLAEEEEQARRRKADGVGSSYIQHRGLCQPDRSPIHKLI